MGEGYLTYIISLVTRYHDPCEVSCMNEAIDLILSTETPEKVLKKPEL